MVPQQADIRSLRAVALAIADSPERFWPRFRQALVLSADVSPEEISVARLRSGTYTGTQIADFRRRPAPTPTIVIGDPDRLPADLAQTRCSRCNGLFRSAHGGDSAACFWCTLAQSVRHFTLKEDGWVLERTSWGMARGFTTWLYPEKRWCTVSVARDVRPMSPVSLSVLSLLREERYIDIEFSLSTESVRVRRGFRGPSLARHGERKDSNGWITADEFELVQSCLPPRLRAQAAA